MRSDRFYNDLACFSTHQADEQEHCSSQIGYVSIGCLLRPKRSAQRLEDQLMSNGSSPSGSPTIPLRTVEPSIVLLARRIRTPARGALTSPSRALSLRRPSEEEPMALADELLAEVGRALPSSAVMRAW